MAHTKFQKHLSIIEEELSKALYNRDATEITHNELETQLKKSMVELTTAKKIQAKAEEPFVVENEEVKHLTSLLIEKQAY